MYGKMFYMMIVKCDIKLTEICLFQLNKHFNAASASDYSILLHLDSKTRTEIDEFSVSGFVGVKTNPDGVGNNTTTSTLVVPTPTRTIESVTSDSVCQISRDL
ncbi:hypothetical protein F5Y14DRAFT_415920, partial [Nemania sp. NC0429]